MISSKDFVPVIASRKGAKSGIDLVSEGVGERTRSRKEDGLRVDGFAGMIGPEGSRAH